MVREPTKIRARPTLGQCGCGAAAVDSDGDTVADCVDQCPNSDDRIDANNDGAPDCLVIPTTSAWGVLVLALLLATAAKAHGIRRSSDRPNARAD